jgi:hypothetical protein
MDDLPSFEMIGDLRMNFSLIKFLLFSHWLVIKQLL